MNIVDILQEVRPAFRHRPVLYTATGNTSMEALELLVLGWRSRFREQGLHKGDAIVLLAANRPEWLGCCFAALAEGLVVVPINPALTSHEVGHIIDHSRPSLLVADRELFELGEQASHQPDRLPLLPSPVAPVLETSVRAAVDCAPQDPAFIFYTSGTTGKPKGAVISHGSVLHTTRLEADHFGFGPVDTTLVVGSLAFIYPLVLNGLSCLRGGAAIALMDKFHPALATELVQRANVTIMMGVPTMYVMLVNYARDHAIAMPSLRLGISGGAVLPPSLVERFTELFEVPLFDLWGLTEGTPLTSYKPGMDAAVRPESCGRALPGVELRVVDAGNVPLPVGQIGEVHARTPSIMNGYYKNPEATRAAVEDGWLRTGDLGKLDADGYLYILGRKKDLIIRAGANVYPSEIEEILFKHPGVADCCVVGVPHPLYGEEVAAFIVRRSAELKGEDVREHCRQFLADYKAPTAIEFIDSLPKGPTGKVLKRVLRELFTAKSEVSV